MTYKEINELIEKIERQNLLPDTTDAQIEANKWRIKHLKALSRPKQIERAYERLDVISERLKNNGFRISPNKLLSD